MSGKKLSFNLIDNAYETFLNFQLDLLCLNKYKYFIVKSVSEITEKLPVTMKISENENPQKDFISELNRFFKSTTKVERDLKKLWLKARENM